MLSKKINLIFKKHGGVLTTAQARTFNISKETLRQANQRADLKKIYRGIYALPDVQLDDLVLTQKIFSRGIYSNESAVMLYGYSTYVPYKYVMTFPYGYHSNNFRKRQIDPIFATKKYYNLGITETSTWLGENVFVYDKEKTIIDVVRSNRFLPNMKEEIIDNFVFDPDSDFGRLQKYAELLGLFDVIQHEVLEYARLLK